MEKQHSKCLRKMREEIVVLPVVSPWEIEKERAHLQAKNDQNDAKRFIHERRSVCPRKQRLASGLLKRGNAFRDVAVVNVARIDLRKTFQRRFNVTCGFLSNAYIIPQGENGFRVDAG